MGSIPFGRPSQGRRSADPAKWGSRMLALTVGSHFDIEITPLRLLHVLLVRCGEGG